MNIGTKINNLITDVKVIANGSVKSYKDKMIDKKLNEIIELRDQQRKELFRESELDYLIALIENDEPNSKGLHKEFTDNLKEKLINLNK